MIIPIGDENPTDQQPVVNWTLIGLNVLVFLFTLGPGGEPTMALLRNYGLIPNNLRAHTFLTSMFLHGGFAHVLGNMLFLWIVGDNVEDRLGRFVYPLFYLACGVAAALAQIAMNPSSPIPMIGASGAVAGVLGMYAVLFPNHQIKLFYWLFYAMGTWYVSAKWVIGLWFVQNLLLTIVFAGSPGGGVAYAAHVGGFALGAGVAFALRTRLLAGTAAPYRPQGPREVPWAPIPSGVDAEGRPYFDEPQPAAVIRPAPARAPARAAGPAGTFVVLQTADVPTEDPNGAAAAVAALTGASAIELARTIGAAPGIVAQGLPESDARTLARALSAGGLPATVRAEEAMRRLPPLHEVARAVFGPTGFECDVGVGVLRVGFDEPILLVAGRVRRAERYAGWADDEGRAGGAYADVLTVFLREGLRLLFVEGDTVCKAVRPGWGVATSLSLRALTVTLLNRGGNPPHNRGVDVLTGGERPGAWVGLTFEGFRAYEAYVDWFWQLRTAV